MCEGFLVPWSLVVCWWYDSLARRAWIAWVRSSSISAARHRRHRGPVGPLRPGGRCMPAISLAPNSAPPHMELGPRLRLWVWHSGRSPRSPRYTLGSPGPNLTVGIVPTRTVGILLESRLHVQRLRGRALGKRPDVLLRVWFVWVGSGPACGVLRHPMWTRGRRRGQGVSYPLGSTLGGCRA